MNDIKNEIDKLSKQILTHPEDSDLYYRRGKLYWRLDERGHAITDFNIAIGLNPDSPAKTYLDMTRGVMDFFNPDIYNP